jgi:hypothetical protein
MTNLVPLSNQTHGSARWQRPQTFDFARARAFVPLGASEIAQAALAVPIVFANHGDTVAPHALMGFQPERNLLVGADGRWMGRYVPLSLCGYPFAMATNEKDEYFLCVEQDNPLVGDLADGERLFDDGGQPSAALQPLIAMFERLKDDLQVAQALAAQLQADGVIQPWPITVRHDAGEAKLEGLHRADANVLAQLPGDAFLRLRASGALALAYAQIFSQPNVELLADIGRVGLQAVAARAHSPQDIDLSWMNNPS